MLEVKFIRQKRQGPNRFITEVLYKRLNKLFMDCCKEFVMAVSERVMVDTGMTLGSLQPLASAVEADIRNDSGKHKSPNKNIKHEAFQSNIGMGKDRSAGIALGQDGFSIEKGSRLTPNMSFTFYITVFQHFLHESTANWGGSSNWQSVDAGHRAFDAYWHKNFAAYVDMNEIVRWMLDAR